MTDSRTGLPRIARFSHWVLAALVVYWIALFIGTHIRITPDMLPPKVSDKTMHYVAYAGLSFLLTIWYSTRRHVPLKSLLIIIIIVCLYGIADELLQIPVGRNADGLDWIADVGGATLGVIMFAICRALYPDPWRSIGAR